MGFLLFLLFAALAFTAVSFSLKDERLRKIVSAIQIASVLGAVGFFTYLFISRSLEPKSGDGVSLQIINQLPQTIDFYSIKTENQNKNPIANVSHIGTIRSDYYRLERLRLKASDGFQILGMLGKNTVYFSTHRLPNLNMDQIITVKNYSIEDDKQAENALKQIANYNSGVRNTAIWITMDLLLLFLDAMLLIKKYRHLFINV